MCQRTGFFSALLFLFVAVLASGCSDDDGGSGGSSSSTVADETEDNADPGPDRDYGVTVPSGYDADTPAPVVMLIHGYGGTPDNVSAYFGMAAAAERYGFILVLPEGTVDSQDKRYWNATDACCVFDSELPDDVAYLTGVLDGVTADYNVDPDRIYIAGHSNGGFMTHRMACELAPRIAAIASFAGVSWNDPSQCDAIEPVSILQIHGDMDEAIHYDGGSIGGAMYPSAVETVGDWAGINGCTGDLIDRPPNLELEVGPPDQETRVQVMDGCPEDGEVELWTILGAGHIPVMVDRWVDHVWTFFEAHPRS